MKALLLLIPALLTITPADPRQAASAESSSGVVLIVLMYETEFDWLLVTSNREPSGVTANAVGPKPTAIGSPTSILVAVL